MNASRALLLAAAGAAALGAGIWAGSRTSPPAPPPAATRSAILLPSPRPIAEFALADQDGSPFTREQLKDHWTLLFAGFTHCPDVCPTTLGVMKALEQQLPAAAARVQMLFLSVDPERDTPAVLKRYVRYFSPTFIGVTGPTPQLDALTSSLGLAYMKAAGATAADYSVDHSAALALINPQAQVAAYFQPPHLAAAIAGDLAGIVGTVQGCEGLVAENAWIREMPPGSDMTAAYAQISNRGAAPLRIEGVATPAFASAGIHRTTIEHAKSTMSPVPGLELAAGGSAALEPGGLHLMLMQPKRALRSGEQVPVSFDCGQNKTEIVFTVRAGQP